MWSSVTERRIGTAGVSSAGTAGLVGAKSAQRVEDRLDQRADLVPADGVVADMRRDDLGCECEQLGAVDTLVFSYCRTLEAVSPRGEQ